jgi:regulation of enolase protein 1 (concanavalin A-like superfamily)
MDTPMASQSSQTGPSVWLWIILALGSVALLGLCCAGGVGGLFWWKWRDRPPLGKGPELAGWGRAIDPDRDCKIAANGPSLVIDVPPIAHDLHAESNRMNAPRVLQDVEGDFSIQVKVCGVVRPTSPGTVPGHLSFQAGGLLLWSDQNNYTRFERAGMNRNGQIVSQASMEARASGRQTMNVAADAPEQDIYLRLERNGNQLTGSYSVDGNKWIFLAPLTANYPPKVRIGVAVINAAQQPLSLRFDDLQIKH